jgi:phosphoribulokinase
MVDYPIIGISGAARSGKDTLCRGLIKYFKSKNLNAERVSLAGDTIKKDLKSLILKKTEIDSFTEDNSQKKLIRPLLVEYGKLMRNTTRGRYFIDMFQPKENTISIITDIRYAEYEKDELYWIKNEINGFLIFIKHEYVFDANDTEKRNNKIIKKQANYRLNWSTLDEKNPIDKKTIDTISKKIGYFYLKRFTTFQSDNLMPLNKF